jgi:hypothetical protein
MTELVQLKWYEVEQAIYVGARRESEALKDNRPKNWKASDDEKISSIDNHMQSAGAEKAVAKRLNINWHASINTFKDGPADVGEGIEVRYARKKGRLKVTKDDHDDRYFVLVWGELPNYEIVGFIRGKDAKQDQFLDDPKGYGEAYFVPPQYLRPFEQLIVVKIRVQDEEQAAPQWLATPAPPLRGLRNDPFDRTVDWPYQQSLPGFCPECGGRGEVLEQFDDDRFPRARPCDRCRMYCQECRKWVEKENHAHEKEQP